MKLTTYLISGAGNTFHLTYMPKAEVERFRPSELRDIAVSICSSHRADGFIFLTNSGDKPISDSCSFSWKFFNNDGSNAEMCGNATRCVGYFIEKQLKNSIQSWSLETVAGKVQIFSEGKNLYRVIMSSFKKMDSSLGFFCDTGVPHLVIESAEADLFGNLTKELKEKSSKLRFHSEFAPKGTNVTYVYLDSNPNKLKAASFERGVENFTAACGTGAAAAAYFNLTKRSIQETEVEMPGGTLIMNLKDLGRPEMIGPAELLGSFDNEISV